MREAQEQYRARNPKSLALLRGGLRRAARRQHALGDLCRAVPADDGERRGLPHLWDADGHEYVDFLCEFTAGLYGHSHPAIRRAHRRGADDGWNQLARTARRGELRQAICDRFPSIELVRFTNSGTEANLMAVARRRARSPAASQDPGVQRRLSRRRVLFPRQGQRRSTRRIDYLLGAYNDIAGTARAGRAARARTSPRS